jgi:hypothetical protein
MTSVQVKDVISAYGQIARLQAIVKLQSPGNEPVKGAAVAFKVNGKPFQTVTANIDGVASVDYPVLGLVQSAYVVEAEFTGKSSEGVGTSARGSGKLRVLKAATVIDVQYNADGAKHFRGKLKLSTPSGIPDFKIGKHLIKVDGSLVGEEKTLEDGYIGFGVSGDPDLSGYVVEIRFDGDEYLLPCMQKIVIKSSSGGSSVGRSRPAKGKLPVMFGK